MVWPRQASRRHPPPALDAEDLLRVASERTGYTKEALADEAERHAERRRKEGRKEKREKALDEALRAAQAARNEGKGASGVLLDLKGRLAELEALADDE